MCIRDRVRGIPKDRLHSKKAMASGFRTGVRLPSPPPKLTLVEHQGAPSLCFLMVLCWHSRKRRTGLKPARLFLVSKSSISNPFLSKGKLRV